MESNPPPKQALYSWTRWSPGITKIPTVQFMLSDPAHSFLCSEAISVSSYKFLWPYSTVSSGNAAYFDLMASDISLALLISQARCQGPSDQRVQQFPAGKRLEPHHTTAGSALQKHADSQC